MIVWVVKMLLTHSNRESHELHASLLRQVFAIQKISVRVIVVDYLWVDRRVSRVDKCLFSWAAARELLPYL